MLMASRAAVDQLRSGPNRASLVDRSMLLIGAVLASIVAWSHRETPLVALGLGVVVVVSARLAAIDFREHRLPNAIVGRLAFGTTLGLVATGIGVGDPGRALTAVVAGAAWCVLLGLLALAGGLGMGDAKYGYCIGAALGWFGLESTQVALAVMTIASRRAIPQPVGAVLLRRGVSGWRS